MRETSAQRLSHVLYLFVMFLFACNIVVLLFGPGIAAITAPDGVEKVIGAASEMGGRLADSRLAFSFWPLFLLFCYVGVWIDVTIAERVVYLWFCCISTAVFLWQAKRVLASIRDSIPFSDDNTRNMKRAAICCFIITAASVVRAIWAVCYHGYFGSLAVYTLLLGLAFLLAGLLCLIMSALFCRATELKAEHDLTI